MLYSRLREIKHLSRNLDNKLPQDLNPGISDAKMLTFFIPFPHPYKLMELTSRWLSQCPLTTSYTRCQKSEAMQKKKDDAKYGETL